MIEESQHIYKNKREYEDVGRKIKDIMNCNKKKWYIMNGKLSRFSIVLLKLLQIIITQFFMIWYGFYGRLY